MRDHEGAVRGFTQLSRAWYANANQVPGRLDEVTFGFYYPEGGTSGEMAVMWEELGGRAVPCLRVFDDAWDALARFGDVVQKMADRDDDNMTPEEFCALLSECGFTDQTPTVNPYDRD